MTILQHHATNIHFHSYITLHHTQPILILQVSKQIRRVHAVPLDGPGESVLEASAEYYKLASSTSAELKQQPHQVFLSLILILPQEMTAKTIL